jgi:hypothetical protein
MAVLGDWSACRPHDHLGLPLEPPVGAALILRYGKDDGTRLARTEDGWVIGDRAASWREVLLLLLPDDGSEPRFEVVIGWRPCEYPLCKGSGRAVGRARFCTNACRVAAARLADRWK